MAHYPFNGFTGLEDDKSYISERQLQNVKFNDYQTTNFRTSGRHFENARETSLMAPGMNLVGGGPGIGVSGYNVAYDSKLRLGAAQTRDPCPVQLQTRPYLTVPYLGRGHTRPGEEYRIKQGAAVSSRKTETGLGEQTHLDYTQTPLIDSVKEKMTNPRYMVEGVASEGWVRGGIPTREFLRAKQNEKK